MPLLKTETFGTGDQSWLGSTHGMFNARTATLDPASFTANTDFPQGYFPAGLPVNVANEATALPWTGASGEQLGFVLTNRPIVSGQKTACPVIRHGIIRTSRLPKALATGSGSTAGFVFVGS